MCLLMPHSSQEGLDYENWVLREEEKEERVLKVANALQIGEVERKFDFFVANLHTHP